MGLLPTSQCSKFVNIFYIFQFFCMIWLPPNEYHRIWMQAEEIFIRKDNMALLVIYQIFVLLLPQNTPSSIFMPNN